MKILWWEKTVEYFFVQKHVHLDMFIAPLDGNQEKAGDAIFSNENSWVLIEFKRDEKTISREIDKFTNYYSAKEKLEPISGHHLVIYGNSDNGKFELKCKKYFSGSKIEVEKALLSGVKKDCFLEYLNEFIDFKKQSKTGSGGYSLVAGISSDGKITKCMSLSEFGEALKIELSLKLKLQKMLEKTQERSYSGPSL